MQAQIQKKIKILLEKQASINGKIEKWRFVESEIQKIEDELSLLQRRIVLLNSEDQESLSNRIQFLIHKQKDIYWEAQSYLERIESRNLNFITFQKQPSFSHRRYDFEIALNTYSKFLLDIINQDKRIWWEELSFATRDKYMNILNKELRGILGRRNQVNLLPKEVMTDIIDRLSKNIFRDKFTNEEWLNFTEFRKLLEQVHLVKRDQVSFF